MLTAEAISIVGATIERTQGSGAMRRKGVVYLMAALIIVGCGSTKQFYDGPKRDGDAVAVLRLDVDSGARVVRIDDRTISENEHDGTGPACFTGKVALLPGTHTIEVLYHNAYYDHATPSTGRTTMTVLTSTDHKELTFTASAGRTYCVEAESHLADWPPNAIIWRTWVVEKNSGELVAVAPAEE